MAKDFESLDLQEVRMPEESCMLAGGAFEQKFLNEYQYLSEDAKNRILKMLDYQYRVVSVKS